MNNNSRFSQGNVLRPCVSVCAIDQKRWPNKMLRVPVYSGVLKLKNVNKKRLYWQAKIARHRFAHGKVFFVSSVNVEGSIFVMMMARSVGFAIVRSEFVSIRLRFAVRRRRGLCWASIVCETLSS